MKQIILLTLLVICLYVTGDAQTCAPGSQCVPQATIDKCADVADRYRASLDTIAKLQAVADAIPIERAGWQAERQAVQNIIDRYKALIDTDAQIQKSQADVIQMLKDVVAMQGKLIGDFEGALNKPKSALNKILTALKEIALIAAGIAIGRGF